MFFFDKPGFSLVILVFSNFIVQNMVYQRKTWFNKEKPGITIAKSGFTEKKKKKKIVVSQVKFDKPGFTKLFVS